MCFTLAKKWLPFLYNVYLYNIKVNFFFLFLLVFDYLCLLSFYLVYGLFHCLDRLLFRMLVKASSSDPKRCTAGSWDS